MGRPTSGTSRDTTFGGAMAFVAVASAVSIALFALSQGLVVDAGCPTISMGPFALVAGMLIGARGLRWSQKWRPLFAMSAGMVTLVALGAPTWFGVYRLGDVSTAPAGLSLVTAVPLLFFLLFALLPWAIPMGVLLVTIGSDPRKLWSSGGRG